MLLERAITQSYKHALNLDMQMEQLLTSEHSITHNRKHSSKCMNVRELSNWEHTAPRSQKHGLNFCMEIQQRLASVRSIPQSA